MINSTPPILILIFFFLSFLGWFDMVQAERQIANYQEFTAIVNDDQSCSENMTVVARHPSPDAFTEQRVQLQRLLGGVQILLNLECPQVRELLIIGESAGKSFYSGVVSSATEWMLKDTPSPVEENIAISPKQKSQDIVGQSLEQAVNTKVESNGTKCDQSALSQAKQGSIRIGTECSSITIFDTLFDKAVRSVKDEMEKKGISFKPSRGLIKSGYSAKKMREVGLWYLKNAKNPFEYEKAFWYLSAAYFMVNKGITNTSDKIHFPEEIYAGQAAAIAATEYANPKSNVYDLDRAYSLHYDAGFLGIQSSFLAAGYIQRFKDFSEYAKRWGYHPADFISNERMLFQRATNCSEENLSRKVFPFTQELCDAAQREMLDAQRRVQVAYSKPYGDDAALWKFMGLVGLAVLAADRGAPTSAEVDTWQQSYKAEQKRIQKQINEDIALGAAAVGTTPGW